MITVHFVSTPSAGPQQVQTVQTPTGRSLMDAASSADVQGIAADCGGLLTCATCHVMVDAAWMDAVGAPSTDEQAMLDFTAVARTPHSRLSCQIALTPALDGLRVELPASQY